MPVSIPISADASGVTAAFAQIQAAIKATGQEGKRFADLDLSHSELKGFAEDIRKIQAQFADLQRVGRGATSDALKAMGREAQTPNNLDPGDWYGQRERFFPDRIGRNRHTENVGNTILRGTQWQSRPSTPGQPEDAEPAEPPSWFKRADQRLGESWARVRAPLGGGGGGEEGGEGEGAAAGKGGGGLLSSLGGGLIGGGFKFALGAAGLSGIAGMAKEGLGQAQDEAVANDQLMRTLRDTGSDFEELRRNIRASSEAFGLTYGEAQRYAQQWAKLTNETSGARTAEAVTFASGVARSYGQDPGQVMQTLGRAQLQGEDPKRFAALIGEAVQQSGMTGRFSEVADALVRWTEQSNRQLAEKPNTDLFASAYSALSSSGKPGLMGSNAEAVLDRINAALSKGGAMGEASQNLTFRALGRYGVTDPYEVQRVEEGGMLERVNRHDPKSPTLLQASVEEINRMYAGTPTVRPGSETEEQANRRHAAIGNHLGLSIRQVEGLEQAIPDGNITPLADTLSKSGIDLKDANPGALRDLVGISTENRSQLETRRTALLGAGGLQAPDARALRGASTDDELRTALARAVNDRGLDRNQGTQVTQSRADSSNTLTAAATALITPINELKGAISSLASPIARLSEVLSAGQKDSGGWSGLLNPFAGRPDIAAISRARRSATSPNPTPRLPAAPAQGTTSADVGSEDAVPPSGRIDGNPAGASQAPTRAPSRPEAARRAPPLLVAPIPAPAPPLRFPRLPIVDEEGESKGSPTETADSKGPIPEPVVASPALPPRPDLVAVSDATPLPVAVARPDHPELPRPAEAPDVGDDLGTGPIPLPTVPPLPLPEHPEHLEPQAPEFPMVEMPPDLPAIPAPEHPAWNERPALPNRPPEIEPPAPVGEGPVPLETVPGGPVPDPPVRERPVYSVPDATLLPPRLPVQDPPARQGARTAASAPVLAPLPPAYRQSEPAPATAFLPPATRNGTAVAPTFGRPGAAATVLPAPSAAAAAVPPASVAQQLMRLPGFAPGAAAAPESSAVSRRVDSGGTAAPVVPADEAGAAAGPSQAAQARVPVGLPVPPAAPPLPHVAPGASPGAAPVLPSGAAGSFSPVISITQAAAPQAETAPVAAIAPTAATAPAASVVSITHAAPGSDAPDPVPAAAPVVSVTTGAPVISVEAAGQSVPSVESNPDPDRSYAPPLTREPSSTGLHTQASSKSILSTTREVEKTDATHERQFAVLPPGVPPLADRGVLSQSAASSDAAKRDIPATLLRGGSAGLPKSGSDYSDPIQEPPVSSAGTGIKAPVVPVDATRQTAENRKSAPGNIPGIIPGTTTGQGSAPRAAPGLVPIPPDPPQLAAGSAQPPLVDRTGLSSGSVDTALAQPNPVSGSARPAAVDAPTLEQSSRSTVEEIRRKSLSVASRTSQHSTVSNVLLQHVGQAASPGGADYSPAPALELGQSKLPTDQQLKPELVYSERSDPKLGHSAVSDAALQQRALIPALAAGTRAGAVAGNVREAQITPAVASGSAPSAQPWMRHAILRDPNAPRVGSPVMVNAEGHEIPIAQRPGREPGHGRGYPLAPPGLAGAAQEQVAAVPFQAGQVPDRGETVAGRVPVAPPVPELARPETEVQEDAGLAQVASGRTRRPGGAAQDDVLAQVASGRAPGTGGASQDDPLAQVASGRSPRLDRERAADPFSQIATGQTRVLPAGAALSAANSDMPATKQAALTGAQHAVAPAGSATRAMLDLIGHSEGTDPDARHPERRGYDETLAYGKFTGGKVDLQGMTVAQVRQLQAGMLAHPDNTMRSSAVGRYQVVGTTLQDAIGAGVVRPDQKFDAAAQDRVGAWLLERRGLSRYQHGEISRDQLGTNLAHEWASLPTAQGRGAYAGQQASVSPEMVTAALNGARPGQPEGTAARPASPALLADYARPVPANDASRLEGGNHRYSTSANLSLRLVSSVSSSITNEVPKLYRGEAGAAGAGGAGGAAASASPMLRPFGQSRDGEDGTAASVLIAAAAANENRPVPVPSIALSAAAGAPGAPGGSGAVGSPVSIFAPSNEAAKTNMAAAGAVAGAAGGPGAAGGNGQGGRIEALSGNPTTLSGDSRAIPAGYALGKPTPAPVPPVPPVQFSQPSDETGRIMPPVLASAELGAAGGAGGLGGTSVSAPTPPVPTMQFSQPSDEGGRITPLVLAAGPAGRPAVSPAVLPAPGPAVPAIPANSNTTSLPSFGTALPDDERDRTQEAAMQRLDVATSATIAPLRVVHETAAGEHIGEDHLPVTTVTAPRAWGARSVA